MSLKDVVSREKDAERERKIMDDVERVKAIEDYNPEISFDELQRLKKLYSEIDKFSIYSNSRKVLFVRSATSKTQKIYVERKPPAGDLGRAVDDLTLPQKHKMYDITNPSYIFVICDEYVFSYGKYPVNSVTAGLIDENKLFFVTGKGGFVEFDSISNLRTPNVDNLIRYFPNLREVENSSPYEIEKIGVFADTFEGRSFKRRRLVATLLTRSGCLLLPVSIFAGTYSLAQMGIQAIAVLLLIVAALLYFSGETNRSNYKPKNIKIGRRVTRSEFS